MANEEAVSCCWSPLLHVGISSVIENKLEFINRSDPLKIYMVDRI